MITARLYLRNPKEEKSGVYYEIRVDGEKVRISTEVQVPTMYWDAKARTIKKGCPDFVFLSQKLSSFNAIASKQVLIADATGLSASVLKRNILVALGRVSEENEDAQLLPFYKWWSQHAFGVHNPTRSNYYNYRTLEAYLTMKNKKKLQFSEVDYNFYIEYRTYLEITKNYKPNTVATHFRDLKTVMNEAKIRGKHNSDAFQVIRCKFVDVDTIYLSVDEINTLYRFPLSGGEERVRDLFVLGCHTAMRFQDYSTLSLSVISNNRITVKTKKTSETVIIPAHPRVIEILNKWGGKAPFMEQSYVTRVIKDICKRTGCFNQMVPIKKGKAIEYIEKYKLVSPHTARRSGATNMYIAGIPAQSIMKITGHQTEQSFMKYLRITKEENANLLASNPFFNE